MNAKERRLLHSQLQDLDEKDADLNTWEAGFLESLLTRDPSVWTDRQIDVAKDLVDKYSTEQRGRQEVIVKYPPNWPGKKKP